MEMRLRAPVTRGYFFSSAFCASLTRLRREMSIRKKYPLEPRVPEALTDSGFLANRASIVFHFCERQQKLTV